MKCLIGHVTTSDDIKHHDQLLGQGASHNLNVRFRNLKPKPSVHRLYTTGVRQAAKARLHGSPRLINAVESSKLNSTAERYCLHSSTKVNEAVDFKMAANELVREGVVVICDYLMKGCQHILEKRSKRKKTMFYSFYTEEKAVTCLLIRVICGESPKVNQRR